MPGRVLHVLSQRPARTGSGITLEALARQAGLAGWVQAAVVGIPQGEATPAVGPLAPEAIFPVTFGNAGPEPADLPYPLPGMSDVMPYKSTVWSSLDADRLDRYRQVWRRHLTRVVEQFRPDLIHAHHIWLVSSLLPEIAAGIPLVITCHATGLRQMELCPHLAEEVRARCRLADHFFALRRDQQSRLAELLEVDPARVTLAGVGFREDLFHPDPSLTAEPGTVLYVGKYSRAKGLPWLLDAVATVRDQHPATVLHVAGDGSGPEAEQLRRHMVAMGNAVVRHGPLTQEDLADLMRRCRVCVLPSFYEGVPLVLAEAAACGCRVVATDLPGVREQLAPRLGSRLSLVPLPPLEGVDTPAAAGLPHFTAALTRAVATALWESPASDPSDNLDLVPLTWPAVFARVEVVWRDLMGKKQRD